MEERFMTLNEYIMQLPPELIACALADSICLAVEFGSPPSAEVVSALQGMVDISPILYHAIIEDTDAKYHIKSKEDD